MKLASRLQTVKPSSTLAVTAKVLELKAQGREVIERFVRNDLASRERPVAIEMEFRFRIGNNQVNGRWDRIDQRTEGVVLVDESYCLGCRYCVQACPYGCRYIDPRTNTVDKCTLCYHRITKGLTTACSEVCPTGARKLADLKDPKDPVHEFMRTHKVHVLKPQMATGAKVYYNALDGSVR